MNRTIPLLTVAFFTFCIWPLGMLSSWMSGDESLSPYSAYAFFLMLLVAFAAIVLVPFATRAFLRKSDD